MLDDALVEQRGLLALVDLEDGGVLGEGGLELEVASEGDAHADERLDLPGVVLEDLLEGAGSQLVVGSPHREDAEVHVGFEVVGVQLDRLLEFEDRCFLVALLQPGQAEVVVDVSVLVIHLQGVCRGHLAHAVALCQEVDPRQRFLCPGVLGIGEQQLLDHSHTVIKAASLAQGAGVVVDHVAIVGILLQVALVDRQGVRRLASVEKRYGQVLYCGREARVGFEGPLVQLDRFLVAPEPCGSDTGVVATPSMGPGELGANVTGGLELTEHLVVGHLVGGTPLFEEFYARAVRVLGVLGILLTTVLGATFGAADQDQGQGRQQQQTCEAEVTKETSIHLRGFHHAVHSWKSAVV